MIATPSVERMDNICAAGYSRPEAGLKQIIHTESNWNFGQTEIDHRGRQTRHFVPNTGPC